MSGGEPSSIKGDPLCAAASRPQGCTMSPVLFIFYPGFIIPNVCRNCKGKGRYSVGLALYNKWRPMRLDDVIGQEHITRTLKNQAAQGRLSHAYLFCGPRGTGKTTCARILAKAANCLSPVNGDPCNRCDACRAINDGIATDVFELDAATYTGVDSIRDLRDEAVYAPAELRRKVYIMDEVHMLSTSAFNALLKILEEPPEHVMFVLASTELHKIPATILSRCQRFEFRRIERRDIARRLMKVAAEENIPLADSGAMTIAHMSDGAMRNALSLLEQASALSAADTTLDNDGVSKALGLVTAEALLNCAASIASGDAKAVLQLFTAQYETGVEPAGFADRLMALYRDLLIRKTSDTDILIGSGYTVSDLNRLLPMYSPERLLYSVKTLRDALLQLNRSPNRRIDVEMALLALCKPILGGDGAALAARIAEVEKRMASGFVPAAPAGEAVPDAPAAPAASDSAPVQPAAAPAADSKAAPAPSAPAATAPTSGGMQPINFRDELVSALRDTLDRMTYSYIKTCDIVAGGGKLVLRAPDDMTYEIVSRRKTLDAVAETLAVLGRSYRASAELVGQEAAADSSDGFSELVSFAEENPEIATFFK